jgi:subtilase-type serine protease
MADLQNLSAIGIEAARAAGLTGQGIIVGILDSAVDISHPEFAGRILGTYDHTTGGPVAFIPMDSHGTHVLGTIAGQTVGVAPGASLLSASIEPALAVDPTDEANVMIPDAMRWAIDGGARVINNSWGYDFEVTQVTAEEYQNGFPGLFDDYGVLNLQGLLQGFRETADAGVVMVWAAGNTGWENPAIDAGAPFHFPELQPTWIAVAALAGDGTIASYSNRCGVAARWCIGAPGGDDEQGILSSVIGGGTESENWSGTSMAAPHVSGAVAIGMELFPNADPRDIVQLVLRTATDIGEPGVDGVYGWGFLNLSNLVSTTESKTTSVFANAAWSRFAALDVAGSALRQRAEGRSVPSITRDADASDERWLLPLAGLSRIDKGPASAAATSRSAGFLAGADIFEDDQWRVGVGAGYSRTSLGESGRSDGANTDALHGVAYARYEAGPWFAQMSGQVAAFRQEVERQSISGTLGTAERPVGASRLEGMAVGGDLRFGREVFQSEARSVATYLASNAMAQRTDGFSERDAGVFGLTGDRSTLSQYAAGVGLRWTEEIARGADAPVEIVTDFAVMRRFGDLDHASSLSLLGLQIPASTGGLSEDILRISGRVVAPMTLGEAYLGYDATLPDAALSLSLGLNMRF